MTPATKAARRAPASGGSREDARQAAGDAGGPGPGTVEAGGAGIALQLLDSKGWN